MPEGMERNTNVWNLPDDILGCSTKTFSLAAMISGPQHALANFAATGVCEQIVFDSLGYIGRYARDIEAKRGVWGLESIGWLSEYVRANVFRLGRLTFKSGKMGQPFRAFRHRQTGEVRVLCEGAGRYRQDGLSDGTNDVFDPNPWTPVLEISENAITGHRTSGEASVLLDQITMPTTEWEQVMAQGDEAVEVHVAGGSRLLPEECADAYRQALEFFPKHYPNANFKGFTIWSWLLDPNLAAILPPESNIVRFQRDFHQLPVCANEAQAYDLVFGDSKVDPTKFHCRTKLQEAIADYVRSGGRLRSAGGIITWDEAKEDSTEGIVSNNLAFVDIDRMDHELLPDWLDLFELSFPPEEKVLISRFLRLLKDKTAGENQDSHMLAAVDENGNVIGIMRFDNDPDTRISYFWYLAVRSGRTRSRGIGSACFAEVLRRATEADMRAIVFEVEIPEEQSDLSHREYAERRIGFYREARCSTASAESTTFTRLAPTSRRSSCTLWSAL